jgi:hypothetical protein
MDHQFTARKLLHGRQKGGGSPHLGHRSGGGGTHLAPMHHLPPIITTSQEAGTPQSCSSSPQEGRRGLMAESTRARHRSLSGGDGTANGFDGNAAAEEKMALLSHYSARNNGNSSEGDVSTSIV